MNLGDVVREIVIEPIEQPTRVPQPEPEPERQAPSPEREPISQ
jgi:hypothetical protein